MCAILGFLGLGNLNDLIQMRDEMTHRGPDGDGFFFDKDRKIFLGHKRLSIIDHIGGEQPMWDMQKKICLVYNGEIYNHLELRKNLISKGHIFRSSHSDTEVLIHGYKEWGTDLPKHLNGMFAFCIFDKMKSKMFLARDRFGEKPLFYYHHNNIFGFSSELKTFKNYKNLSLKLNVTNLQKYFAYGYFPSSKTAFNNFSHINLGFWQKISKTSILTTFLK